MGCNNLQENVLIFCEFTCFRFEHQPNAVLFFIRALNSYRRCIRFFICVCIFEQETVNMIIDTTIVTYLGPSVVCILHDAGVNNLQPVTQHFCISRRNRDIGVVLSLCLESINLIGLFPAIGDIDWFQSIVKISIFCILSFNTKHPASSYLFKGFTFSLNIRLGI